MNHTIHSGCQPWPACNKLESAGQLVCHERGLCLPAWTGSRGNRGTHLQEGVAQLGDDAAALVDAVVAGQVQPLVLPGRRRHIHRQQLEVVLALAA